MYHYVYKLTHIETNEFYFGSRTSELHPTLDKYFGSMKKWSPDKTKLIKIIIKDDFQNRTDAVIFEANLITKHINENLNRNYHIPPNKFNSIGFVSVKDKNGNVFSTSKSDPRYISGELVGVFKNRTHSIKSRQKMSEYHKLHHSNQGEKNSQYNTKWITNGIINKKIKNNEELPEGWRYGFINFPMIGYKWITNGIDDKKIFNNNEIPEGWHLGRTKYK